MSEQYYQKCMDACLTPVAEENHAAVAFPKEKNLLQNQKTGDKGFKESSSKHKENPGYAKRSVMVLLPLIFLLWACNNQPGKHSMNQTNESEWSANFDSVGQQFQHIREAYGRDSSGLSPQSQMIFHNMETLWAQMSQMRGGSMQQTGKKNNDGMMGNGGMMGRKGMGANSMMEGRSMMQFHNMNQQMMSYAQGMHQMMQQSGNSSMASMYGDMANRMQEMISKFSPVKGGPPSSSGTSGDALNGASLFVANCSSCHGADGSGIRGAFPPLNGSSIVQGDKGSLIKILLHGLQGQVTVKGEQYNGTMPSFGNILSDEQISATLTYIRSMPENTAGAVSSEEVSKVRSETSARQQAWTPNELGLK
jgi:mono/diheme cytochrome c family protein